MRTYIQIISISLLAIVIFWTLDAAVDYFVHYDESFLEILFFNKAEVAFRLLFASCFLLFGIAMSCLIGKLKSETAKFENLFELASDAIFIIDMKGNFINANNTAYTRLGYTKDELLSMHITELDPPEFAEKVPERLSQLQKEGIAVFESAHKRKDGSIMPVEINARVIDYGRSKCFLSIVRDIEERKKLESSLKKTIEEKKMLMRELHHRIKNNLAVIQSLLRLQLIEVSDEQSKSYLLDVQNRVKSMSMLHDSLSRSDTLSTVNISEFVHRLVDQLFQCYKPAGVRVDINVPDINIDINTVMPCALIINELVTNSLKHAFPDGREGVVSVSLEEKNGREYILSVKDNGTGIPGDIDIGKARSLGLMIVSSLIGQLKGSMELLRDSGTEFRITFRESQFD